MSVALLVRLSLSTDYRARQEAQQHTVRLLAGFVPSRELRLDRRDERAPKVAPSRLVCALHKVLVGGDAAAASDTKKKSTRVLYEE